jgi:colanic acid biosynthesis glycosyl transferase WcaI
LLILSKKLQTETMRVLLINQVFYPDPQSTGQHLSGLAQGLVRHGHHVTVLTSRRGYDDPTRSYPARETWRGIDIIRVWSSGFGHGMKWHRILDFATFLVSAMLRALFLPRADAVVTLTTPPLLSVLGAGLAKVWRGRFIYWVMDLNPDEAIAVGWLKADGTLTHLLESMSRWSLRQADWVIVLDDYMRERVVAKGIAPQKIVTVSIWMHGDVRFDAEGRKRFRREHGLVEKFVVMYSGNHTPVHPLDTLVEAAAALRNDSRLHFCFVGGGIEWRKLRDRARLEAWPNATFLGYQPFEALSDSLSAADVQVVAMGNAFVGIVHPCKIYNFLAVERPFIFIGPERGHVPDLIRAAGLGALAGTVRHGESRALADELRRRADATESGLVSTWPARERLAPWTEAAAVEKIVGLIENPRAKS